MSKRARLVVAVVVVLAVAGVATWWFTRDKPVPSAMPSTAPTVGSCWRVDPGTVRNAFPWPGAPLGCASLHTAEVYQRGQVDHVLIRTARKGGTDGNAAKALMGAEVRRACESAASTYLGQEWRRLQVTVLANWVTPADDGFYACALAQTKDAAGAKPVDRSGVLKSADLPITCVNGGDFSPCDQPHDAEFAGSFTLTPPNAPFDEASVKNTANNGCASILRNYLGLPEGTGRPDLSVGYVGPTTPATWLGSDQTFDCYGRANVKLRGSIRSLGTRPLPS
jgi:Septum formation